MQLNKIGCLNLHGSQLFWGQIMCHYFPIVAVDPIYVADLSVNHACGFSCAFKESKGFLHFTDIRTSWIILALVQGLYWAISEILSYEAATRGPGLA